MAYAVDEKQVCDMIITEQRRQYTGKQLSACQVCEVLSKIQSICGFGEPWFDLYKYLYEYELLDEGKISQKVFEIGFAFVFLNEEHIDVWQLQKEHNQKKKKSILDIFRKQKRKEDFHDRNKGTI